VFQLQLQRLGLNNMLDFKTLASSLTSNYTSMNAGSQGVGTQVKYPAIPGTNWVDFWSTTYDADANAGTFSSTSVVMSSSPNLLKFTATHVCNGTNMIGAKISAYWASQTAKGVPQFLTTISSVTNNASTIQATIDTWMCSRNSVSSVNSYEAMCSMIETAVKSITWTVTETSGTASTTYSVSIS